MWKQLCTSVHLQYPYESLHAHVFVLPIFSFLCLRSLARNVMERDAKYSSIQALVDGIHRSRFLWKLGLVRFLDHAALSCRKVPGIKEIWFVKAWLISLSKRWPTPSEVGCSALVYNRRHRATTVLVGLLLPTWGLGVNRITKNKQTNKQKDRLQW